MISGETTLCILQKRNEEDSTSVKDYLILKLEN